MPAPERYRFGPYEVNGSDGCLFRKGERLALMPKTFEVLLHLVRRAGRVVRKEELLQLVWPDCFVEDGILAVHISNLRRALAPGGQRYIETIPRSGYRFAAVVEQFRSSAEPASPEVCELFGRGRAHLLAASRSDIPKAEAAFRAAIALAPDYAAAHAGLALACCAKAEYRLAPPAHAFKHAREAAQTALQIDELCSDGHAALGAVALLGEWDWIAARKHLERALELNPNHTEAYLLLGRLQEALGDVGAGLAFKQRALERDPLSAVVHLQIALSYWNLRQYDAMIAWATRSLELDPKHLAAREHIAAAWWKKGDFDRYLMEVASHAATSGAPAEVVDRMKDAGRGGPRSFFRWAIDCVRQQPNVPALQLAIHYGEAGDIDTALIHLNRAIDQRDPCLLTLAVSPQWDTLRNDRRFRDSLARMGLQECGVPVCST